jgi:hypothetical protein
MIRNLLTFNINWFRISFLMGIIALLTTQQSCEKEIDWELQNNELPSIVVEAMLTNENKIHEIRLTHPVKNINEAPGTVNGAIVKITSGHFEYPFTESDEIAGTYQSNFPFAATIDRDYELHIHYENKNYWAQTYMVPVSVPDPPRFEFVKSRNMFRIDWNNPQFNLQEQAMYEADISWEHLPEFDTQDTLTRARFTYFTFNTIDVSYNIAPQDKEEIYFPAGSIVTLSKYSLTPEFANYMRALLAETQWQGSIFEDARGNLSGNVSNGGLGYFSACSVIRVTITVSQTPGY